MSVLKEIAAVLDINTRSLPKRVGSSLVVVVGIAAVVAVLISVLSVSRGLTRTLSTTGRVERAIVLYGGAQSEIESSVSRDAVSTIADLHGIKRDTDGKSLISADAVTSIWLPKKNGELSSVVLRGVSTKSMIVRPEIKLTAGRNFKPGLREVIVGRAVLERFSGLGVGSSFSSGVAEWTIVGLFESGGDAHESELLADADTVLSAYSRSSFNSVTIWLDNPSSFESIKDSISTNATYSLDVRHESDYYEQQSKRFGRFLSVIANVVGIVMAFGAIFGALNTMYTAVSTRAVEIATLRALGFGAVGVIVSVFVEALLLALIGALIGATLAWVAFNGNTVSTISGGYSLTQVTFNLKVGPDLLVIGIVWACAVGLLGALFPAIRAARTSVADALRQI